MKERFANRTIWHAGSTRITGSRRLDNRRILGALALAAVFQLLPAGDAAAATLRVPEHFPTIQSAINAANPGDTIKLAAGTFREQVIIAKDLTLKGAGAGDDGLSRSYDDHNDVTTITAPATLVPGPIGGRREIITIMGGAKVNISDLRVSGPGTEPCDSPTSLNGGVLVVENATLNMHSAAVTDIRGASTSPHCPLVGAIMIGLPAILNGGPAAGHGMISDSFVRGYSTFGLSVSGPNSTATFAHNRVTGLGLAGHTATVGVSVGFGARATVVGNSVTDNLCDAPVCGSDPISQLQSAGISAIFASAGTEIAHNHVARNDTGIGLFFSPNCCSVNHNTLTDNRFFGEVIQDGDNTISDDMISGGEFGVGVVADAANTTGTLRKLTIRGALTAPVKELSCCGFTAKAVIQ